MYRLRALHPYKHLAHGALRQPGESFFYPFKGNNGIYLRPSSNGVEPTDDLFPYRVSLRSVIVTDRDSTHPNAAEQQQGRIQFGYRPSASSHDTDSAAIPEERQELGQ